MVEAVLRAGLEHLWLSLGALTTILIIGVPLGIFNSSVPALAPANLGVNGFLYTIPSLPFFGFAIPLLSIDPRPTDAAPPSTQQV